MKTNIIILKELFKMLIQGLKDTDFNNLYQEVNMFNTTRTLTNEEIKETLNRNQTSY